MPVMDAKDFLADSEVSMFKRTFEIDLVGAGAADILNSEEFLIFRRRVEPGQVEVIHNIAPFAKARINVGTPDETVVMISPEQGDGAFIYSPRVANQPVPNIGIDVPPPATSATASNAERITRNGFTHLSPSPWVDAHRYSPAFRIEVRARVIFEMTFSLLPAATNATPIPNPFAIGGTPPRRVDFAGVVIYGTVMSSQVYDRVKAARLKENG